MHVDIRCQSHNSFTEQLNCLFRKHSGLLPPLTCGDCQAVPHSLYDDLIFPGKTSEYLLLFARGNSKLEEKISVLSQSFSKAEYKQYHLVGFTVNSGTHACAVIAENTKFTLYDMDKKRDLEKEDYQNTKQLIRLYRKSRN